MNTSKGAISVSVALCTHNGVSYLREQLESFVSQSMLPDELVACDDASTDHTLTTLEEFRRTAPFSVHVFQNDHPLGVTRNFEKALSLCSGSLIALADQDDVWDLSKLATAVGLFQADPTLGAVFSDAEVVDASLKPLGYTMWQHVGFAPAELGAVERGAALEVLLKHYVVTGATLVFRSDLRPRLLPIPDGWYHDAWVATLAAAVSRIAAIPRCLMRYRQHGANAIGGRFDGYLPQAASGLRLGRDTYYREEIGRFERLRDRLLEIGHHCTRSDAAELVQAKLHHLHTRSRLPRNRLLRLSGVMRQLATGGYARFAKDWRSVAMDLFFP